MALCVEFVQEQLSGPFNWSNKTFIITYKRAKSLFLSLKATETKGTASSINYFGHKFLANMINRTGNSGVLPSLEGFK